MENTSKSLISIGKMAEISHVSIATLRLYDDMGLLKPAYISSETRYRYYDIRQISRLDLIRYMREMDMTLSDIKTVLQKEDIDLIEQKLIEKNNQIHQQMRDLKDKHEAVERAINSIERYRKSPASGTILLEYIDQRYIIYQSCSNDFYKEGIVSYEQAVMNLRNWLIEKKLPQVLSYNLGTSINKQDFENNRLVADKIFVFGDKDLKNYSNAVALLDSGMYVCMYIDGFDKELTGIEKLKKYCSEHQYIISGDYICEEMTELNVFDSKQRNMFLRLQVPVIFTSSNK